MVIVSGRYLQAPCSTSFCLNAVDATTRVFTRKSNMLFFSSAYFAYFINKDKNSLVSYLLSRMQFCNGQFLSLLEESKNSFNIILFERRRHDDACFHAKKQHASFLFSISSVVVKKGLGLTNLLKQKMQLFDESFFA